MDIKMNCFLTHFFMAFNVVPTMWCDPFLWVSPKNHPLAGWNLSTANLKLPLYGFCSLLPVTLAAKRTTPLGPVNYIFARVPFWLRSPCHLKDVWVDTTWHVATEFLILVRCFDRKNTTKWGKLTHDNAYGNIWYKRHWLPRATLRQKCNFHLISLILYFCSC